MNRELTFNQAILEATDLCMAKDPAVYVVGLGVPDPGGIFGTTIGLDEKYGQKRVFDMPIAENGLTGIAIGSALIGMRPILTHQRIDFALYSIDQIINQAAKWHYTFAGKANVPIVIRMIIGRGWGQGPQHSQSLQALFTHIPGLKVVMPFSPYDAKGLLISSIEDDNPVIFIEHRWLQNLWGKVPEEVYRVPIGKANVIKDGTDISIISHSHMTYEALKAAQLLKEKGVLVEVVDIRSLRPLDEETIMRSVIKTGRVIILDTGWKFNGFSAELMSLIIEQGFYNLKKPPVRIALPDFPVPTSPALTKNYYPGVKDIVCKVGELLEIDFGNAFSEKLKNEIPHDLPDLQFKGPF